MTSLDSSGSLIYLPSGDIYHIS
ncbi:toxin B, partial [Escherichia coli]|nr:toxin B [Escherichia coli]EEV4249395.1 toxin B [Escherichia coli]EEX6791764.1 toxin B [Escherichia coli]EFF4578235.1 toxin B [Escherichia coli]EFU7935838.1 toxin B [Escherichia coli]